MHLCMIMSLTKVGSMKQAGSYHILMWSMSGSNLIGKPLEPLPHLKHTQISDRFDCTKSTI